MVTRRTAGQVAGARESIALAATLGGHIRSARRKRGLTLRSLAQRVGISVTRLSEIERGLGARAPLETWVALGVALGRPLAVQLSRPLGVSAQGPSDAGHLVIQEAILALARRTGRHGTFELPTRPADPARSSDVGVRDPHHGVRILIECWNTFGDLGAAVRTSHRKLEEARATWPDDRITTVWVVRDTGANRALLARFPHILDATFSGSSRRWLDALTDGRVAPPDAPGLLWFDAATGRLSERRRARMAP